MQTLLFPRINFADPAKCFHEGEREESALREAKFERIERITLAITYLAGYSSWHEMPGSQS
jgi:hypothetical protein